MRLQIDLTPSLKKVIIDNVNFSIYKLDWECIYEGFNFW